MRDLGGVKLFTEADVGRVTEERICTVGQIGEQVTEVSLCLLILVGFERLGSGKVSANIRNFTDAFALLELAALRSG